MDLSDLYIRSSAGSSGGSRSGFGRIHCHRRLRPIERLGSRGAAGRLRESTALAEAPRQLRASHSVAPAHLRRFLANGNQVPLSAFTHVEIPRLPSPSIIRGSSRW